MGRKQLSNKDKRRIAVELKKLGLLDFIGKKDDVAVIDDELLEVDGKMQFIIKEGQYVPMLKLLLSNQFLPEVVVDMGAVKFMVSGADVMRPGITSIPKGLSKDQLVTIVDETHHKPLAVAKALYKGEEIDQMTGGKVFANLHWVGDPYWQF